MNKYLKKIWLSALWTVLIFILLSVNTNSVPGSGLMKIKGFDKLIHGVLFIFFSFFWGSYLIFSKHIKTPQVVGIVFLIGSLYGLGMEYYQLYFTSRSFSYWDAVADSIGAIIGGWIAIKKPL